MEAYKITLFSFLLMVSFCCCWSTKKIPKIAVIGGGIGGASTVHFLEELFGPANVQIDVFEPNNIGGRLATTTVDGNEFELGGSVIHPRNSHVNTFMDILGLKKRYSPHSLFALFDGKKVVFSEDSNWYLLNVLKLIKRYHLGPFYLNRYIDDMLSKFDRIYALQDDGKHYSTVTELLNDMSPDFVEGLQETAGSGFKRSGFGDLLVDELILATLAVNYGQTLDVHKFVGSVSIAGVVGDLYSVHGGNRRIPEGLLEKSNAMIIKARVMNITLEESNAFRVVYSDSNSLNASLYDIVIIAMPLAENIESGIEFINFPKKFAFPGKYHQTVCTIVVGNLNYSYFGLGEEVTEVFSLDDSLFFSSVGKISPVDGLRSKNLPDVWKVFSHEMLTNSQMSTLFSDRKYIKVKKWLAYPHYSSGLRSDSFVLHPNLYHVNGIEWAASAMEMSAVGAKNVALLAYEKWTGLKPKGKPKMTEQEL
ncbi:prenylcysteine oxidase 1 [Anabrus simplex]|uniref:prenylcysteine oxidase 1 n=1 Tax=Anabrus simplex TaxID=316456 RepID=UPI0035A2B068